MSTSAIIAISTDQQHTQNIAAIKERLLAKFPTIAAQNWGMNVRILRSTATTPDNKASLDIHYILRATHLDDDTYLAIEKGNSFSVISISADDTDAFVKMLMEKFNTMWTTKMLFALANGAAYDLDDVTIRLGELRIPSSPQTVRGILCFVSLAPSHERAAQAVLADVVDALGFSEAKKYSRTWTSNDRTDEIKLWCDALNQRS